MFTFRIPTICIVDTNCNPDLIPYPIPANDDSSSSINFILNYLVNRITAGYNINDKRKVQINFKSNFFLF
jgi:small subunit ribosomal protein S2